jgi:fibro-slime domain-containing protein
MNSSGFSGTPSVRWTTAALGACLLVAGAYGQDAPSQFVLPVILRDFSKDHADFNVIPADGYAYYHGNVALDLDTDGKPLYTGAGFKAGSLWKTIDGRPIAPHLYNTCAFLTPLGGGEPGASSFGLAVDRELTVRNHSVIDGFDSNLGPLADESASLPAVVRVNGTAAEGPERGRHPWWRRGPRCEPVVEVWRYSTIDGDVMVAPGLDPAAAVRTKWRSTVTGTIGQLDAAVDMPELTPPELGGSEGKVTYKGGEHTISADLHCRELTLRRGAVVEIEGDVTILVDHQLTVKDRSEIRLLPEASLTLYVAGSMSVVRGSAINMDPADPQRVSVFMLTDDDRGKGHKYGKHKLTLDRGARMAAWVQGPKTILRLDDRSEFFGAFLGESVRVEDRSRFHVDMAAGSGGGGIVYEPVECELGDTAGTVALASGGDVLSAGTFAEWWRDVLGVNMSTVQSLTFTRDASGTYAFINDQFRPLDGQLLGDEGDVHNYHFTLELDAGFTYDASAGQWLEVRCTDDAYVFINGRLVIDLCGYGFNRVQYVDLDRLGLPDGEPARLQLFHAQRQRGLAIFRVKTNLVLAGNGASPTVNAILED